MSSPTSELISEVVKAGAGAGKTTRLTSEVLKSAEFILKSSDRLPKIVVTTFTRKATEELKERIVAEALKRNNPKLLEFAASPSHLQISTIHGVCSLFLRRYGQALGLDANFTVVDGFGDEFLRKSICKRLHDESFGRESLWSILGFQSVLDALNAYYSKSFEPQGFEPARSIDFKVTAETIVLKEIDNLKSLVNSISSQTDNEKWKNYCGELNIILQKPAVELNLDHFKALPRKPIFKETYFAESSHLKLQAAIKSIKSILEKLGFQPENWSMLEQCNLELASLGKKFANSLYEEKLKNGKLTSDDLESFCLKLIKQKPHLAEFFANDWDHWFLDEYQDTSPLQVELLKQFCGKAPVFTVGDPQQSIYLFRGSDMRVFEERQSSVQSAGGVFSKLNKNYRSRPELMSCINDLIGAMGENFQRMELRDKISNPQAEVLHLDPFEDYKNIAHFIIEKINRGGRFDDFAVLARTNQVLMDVAYTLEEHGIPTEVHSSTEFYLRREILDVVSLIKFFINPYDDMNLIRLLRSPWYRVSDQHIYESLQGSKASYWKRFNEKASEHSSIQRLKTALAHAENEGVLRTLIWAVSESGMLDASHLHDVTGRRESNIWKFMTHLQSEERSPGFTYTQFLRDIERSWKSGGEDSDAVAALEPNRVALMTIHKSKGLKFKHVIIPRMDQVPRLTQSRAHEMPIVWNIEKKLWSMRVPLPPEDKKSHSPVAIESLEDLSKKEREESKRLLYVALTRASDSLYFQWKVDAKKGASKDSWVGLLEKSFSKLRSSNSYKIKDIKSSDISPSLQIANEKQSILRDPFQALDQVSLSKRVSVTGLLEAKGPVTKSKLLNPEDNTNLLKSLEAPALGTQIHKVFEALHYQWDLNLGDYLESKLHIEAIQKVLQTEEIPLKSLIQNGQVEWGFQLKTKRGILEGQVDLWGIDGDDLWVIDYKSGSDAHMEKAFSQLEIYGYVLAQLHPDKRIQLCVLYPLSQKVVSRELVDVEGVAGRFGL